METMFHHLLDQAAAGLIPPTCVLCGAPGSAGLDLCAACRDELPRNRPACPRCALPLTAGMVPGAPCGACQHHPPPQTVAYVPYLYQDTIRALIAGAKFRGQLNLARLLGLCLADSAREAGVARPDLILPVPLHPRRLQSRGYNQALEMARALSKELGIPVDADTCVRLRAITPQEGLEKEARKRNVRGAFGVTAPIRAQHVALLDDVVTTGSTAAEVTTTLLQAGAKRVDLWAVARTPSLYC